MHFFYRLYSLPGRIEPNRELRVCLATFLDDYPSSVTNPMALLRKFLEEQRHWPREWLYEGDLEADLLRTLGQIQKAAKEELVGSD
jgi:hypothetical protein